MYLCSVCSFIYFLAPLLSFDSTFPSSSIFLAFSINLILSFLSFFSLSSEYIMRSLFPSYSISLYLIPFVISSNSPSKISTFCICFIDLPTMNSYPEFSTTSILFLLIIPLTDTIITFPKLYLLFIFSIASLNVCPSKVFPRYISKCTGILS